MLLATLDPAIVVPVGIFYRASRPTYDQAAGAQLLEARKKLGDGDLEKLLFAGDTWEVN